MRDEERKEIFIALEKAWDKHPEYRLGQLLVNALCPPGHPARGIHTEVFFYQTDEGWLEALKDVANGKE
jgi:hypothetical protein